ncbi:RNA polymerase sigma factor [Agrobacterium rosae]|uniref:RNA polymerase sigma factor n=2 Tax=Agrobacterium rosae TaxID=1972867 RepID=A0AAW9FP13_9HYPH|nr:RNA polymerase sigma factor [Agrobacterium rosae]MDX8304886.1 RNA polymerase sigma factor [Agrobacterium rosae]
MGDTTDQLDTAFIRMQDILRHRIVRIVHEHALAEEIVQNAYLRARTASVVHPLENPEAFLWQTAKNLAIDHWRKAKVRSIYEARNLEENELNNIASTDPSPEALVIQRDLLRAFSQALLKLPPRTQQVWILSRIDGISYPEIAKLLSVSPNTVFNDIKLAMGVLLDLKSQIDPP